MSHRLCLFCKQPVILDDYGHRNWNHEGAEHLCHASCGDWMSAAIRDFEPVSRDFVPPGHSPRVWGWAGISYEQARIDWEQLPDDEKARLHPKYEKALNRTLDHQEFEIRGYCKRAGLPEPTVIRELKQSNRMLSEIKSILTDKACPGDHLVLPQFPRQRRVDADASVYLRRFCRRAAKGGVTVHMAYLRLDWSKPISQAAINLASATARWARDITDANMAYDKGYTEKLFGISWKDLQTNKVFLWTVQLIRDHKMTPLEVGEASKKYHLLAFTNYKNQTVPVLITKDREEAKAARDKDYFWCEPCRRSMLVSTCLRCGARTRHMRLPTISRGLRFGYGGTPDSFGETAARIWAFYCDRNPNQIKLPWMTRTRLP